MWSDSRKLQSLVMFYPTNNSNSAAHQLTLNHHSRPTHPRRPRRRTTTATSSATPSCCTGGAPSKPAPRSSSAFPPRPQLKAVAPHGRSRHRRGSWWSPSAAVRAGRRAGGWTRLGVFARVARPWPSAASSVRWRCEDRACSASAARMGATRHTLWSGSRRTTSAPRAAAVAASLPRARRRRLGTRRLRWRELAGPAAPTPGPLSHRRRKPQRAQRSQGLRAGAGAGGDRECQERVWMVGSVDKM
jgi:hypothetical protein